jgi:uncharacterized protein (DUF362 family)
MAVIRNLVALFLFATSLAQAQLPLAPLPSLPAAPTATPKPARSVVFVAHDTDAIADFHPDPKLVRIMVDRLVTAVTGQADLGKAWGSLVAPNDRVGIKISAAGGQLFTTHREVVNAIVDGLVAAGHPRSSIIVWDRSLTRIKEAGYRPGEEGYQMKDIPPKTGYDDKAILTAPLLGQLVWGDLEYQRELGAIDPLSESQNTSNVSHIAKVLSQDVTKVINVPVMSSAEMNGIAGCLYNMTLPNIDNWRRFAQGNRFGAGSIAEIYSHPLIGQKVVLNVVDGLVAQYAGGPDSQPLYSQQHATIYASKDPVALDSVVLKKLEEWRSHGAVPPIGAMADYVKAAAFGGLGNAAPEKIDIRNVGRDR